MKGPRLRSVAAFGAALLIGLAGFTAWVWWQNVRGDSHQPMVGATRDAAADTGRGAYLARAGNCAGCHTAPGGAAYAGGRGIETPFGTVYAGNLTPNREAGIGSWTSDDFWRALHNGRAADGRLLYPAFPYPNYTQIMRADADALYDFLRTVPASAQPSRPHDLRFPYNQQAALAVWRALYFRPGVYEPQADESVAWNRGAYLVRSLGHCDACHTSRNALGATSGPLELSGGLIPLQQWYAPSLARADEASVARWPEAEVVALLKRGVSASASVLGPMADVVYESTQHLSEPDLQAMAVFLKALPQDNAPADSPRAVDAAALQRGEKLYGDHCAACHGDQGQGVAGAYPALAGNRSVTMNPATNLVRIIEEGGFPPSTTGNPRPYGMPPFGQSLSATQIADLMNYVRNAWGNRAGLVSELDLLLLQTRR